MQWLHRDPATRSERGAWNSAAKELREIGVNDAADVVAHGRRYQAKYPGVEPTPTGLVKHWSETGGTTPKPRMTTRDYLAQEGFDVG